MDMLHVYVDLVASGAPAEQRYPASTHTWSARSPSTAAT
jgi:hypothetical protein